MQIVILMLESLGDTFSLLVCCFYVEGLETQISISLDTPIIKLYSVFGLSIKCIYIYIYMVWLVWSLICWFTHDSPLMENIFGV